MAEVEFLDVVELFDDDGFAVCLSDEPKDLCMSVFAENDDLTFGIVGFCVVLVLFFDALLELEDDGAGGVDGEQSQGCGARLRRFRGAHRGLEGVLSRCAAGVVVGGLW